MNEPNNNFIFLTTPTSATASIWRVLSILGCGEFIFKRYTDDFYHSNRLEKLLDAEIIEYQEAHVLLHNVPQYLNLDQSFESFKFIINVREPKDLLCNMYYWALVHPDPNLSDEELIEKREVIKGKGIDGFVLNNDITLFYEPIMQLVESLPNSEYRFLTYSNMCLDFDDSIKRIAKFLNVKMTKNHWDQLLPERVSNLKDNGSWIGNSWEGSDILPGRYLKELSTDTIEKLNFKYEKIIKFVSEADKSNCL